MISARDVVAANDVLKNVVVRTPLEFDRYLSEKYQATVYLKRENMQKCVLLNCAVPTMPFRSYLMRKSLEVLSVLLRAIMLRGCLYL